MFRGNEGSKISKSLPGASPARRRAAWGGHSLTSTEPSRRYGPFPPQRQARQAGAGPSAEGPDPLGPPPPMGPSNGSKEEAGDRGSVAVLWPGPEGEAAAPPRPACLTPCPKHRTRTCPVVDGGTLHLGDHGPSQDADDTSLTSLGLGDARDHRCALMNKEPEGQADPRPQSPQEVRAAGGHSHVLWDLPCSVRRIPGTLELPLLSTTPELERIILLSPLRR